MQKIKEEHFTMWFAIFHKTVLEYYEVDMTKQYIDRSERMGDNLHKNICMQCAIAQQQK